MADQKLTALSAGSPALASLLYGVDDPAGTPDSVKYTLAQIQALFQAGLGNPQVAQGRISTESGVPVSSSDRTAQGTLYWVPCIPDGTVADTGLVGFYDGAAYVQVSLSQLSLNLATAESGGAIDANEIYDVFIDYNAGTPALVFGPSWTNDTTRATALDQQGPLVVLAGATDWTWVGTIRASGSGVTTDAERLRFMYNAWNQVGRANRAAYTTSHTYASGTVRQMNAVTTNQIEYVLGQPQDASVSVSATVQAGTGGLPVVSAGLDSTTTETIYCFAGVGAALGSGAQAISREMQTTLQVGYHFWSLNERSGNATTETFCVFDLVCDVGVLLWM